ncbi:MAG: type IX secretion system sortase PorU [Bacteroidota bacterium]|nr:type IX secretion system sortase PorU [Bacteroidota bacterium]
MRKIGYLVLTGWFLAFSFRVLAQRNYAPHSVMATGNWYKLGVKSAGVYKMDIPFLNSLGLNTSSLSSASIRLFGNGGQMLAEANAGPWTDDLQENAIQVVDGGDGVLNGSDHILFYANGPDTWVNDPANFRFSHRKNIFSDQSFYFLNVGGNGKRIANAPLITSPAATVSSFSARYFHELDTINFLAGSKEWYGEELSGLPGRSLTRNFSVNLPNMVANSSLLLQTSVVARSVGAGSRFDIRINNQLVSQLLVNAVGGGLYDLVAQPGIGSATATATQNNIEISYTYVPGSFNAQGWLNWFEIFTRRRISLNGIDQLLFRDWLSVGNNAAEFVVNNATAITQVWDITNPINPSRMQGLFSGSEFRFINNCTVLNEYAAFNPANFLIPAVIGKIPNQDLHNAVATDFLIVTHPNLLSQAQRLAALHQQQNGLRTLVVTTEQVYNEFGSGSPDPTATRDYVKMYYDKFGASATNKPRYLLLFGDASFDYKDRIANNTNLVPAYQNNFALDPLSSYTSDDFFGFLDNTEDINSGLVTNLLDIGIGRIPAKNIEEAKNFVDKVAAYFAPQSLGPWRNNLTFIADDEDNNLHLQDAEIITATAANVGPVFNQQKIYLDAFQQESGAGGSSYPQAIQASNNQIYTGTLIWNFNGHGGSRRLAEETILDQDMVNNWNNPDRLPLFITATCDFAPYDNPNINSIGENILLRPRSGAIGLMTTTRVVFAFSNRIINNNYLQFALQPDANGKYKTLGDAIREAKNFTYQNSGDITNNRKFTLLGDPALTLAFPALRVRATKINGIAVATADTLSATEKIVIEGEVTDLSGNLLNNFTGTVYPTVFDKPQTVNTQANDAGSQVAAFQSQTNILFKGKASVTNGRFSFTFKVPKDINYQFGNGKLSLYADDGTKDANGSFTNFIIGGAGNSIGGDNEGPEIKPYLNDELFANGGLVNQNPVLLVKLADSSGINTAGTGIGHDIVATLDNDNRKYFILNDFYEGELNSYQQGVVRFQLPELEAGPHTLKIKAWDVLNNSNETQLEFIVAKDEELELKHVLNYPNPFSTNTNFFFEHNKPGQPLQVQLQIMTITGRTVKSFSRVITTDGNRSAEIQWDGKDDYGDKLGRGVYIYKLRVIAPDKKKKEVIEKLVIL